MKRIAHLAAACLLLTLPAAAHTPQQPPHQSYSEGDLKLESGEAIKDFSISYVTHGTLNAKKSNAILMVTAISGNHHRLDFMIGPGKALDPDKYFIISTDAIANGLTTSPVIMPAITACSAPSPAAPMAATAPTNRTASRTSSARPRRPPGRRSCSVSLSASVIASEAKQSISTRQERMDCFRLRSLSYGGQVVTIAPRNDGDDVAEPATLPQRCPSPPTTENRMTRTISPVPDDNQSHKGPGSAPAVPLDTTKGHRDDEKHNIREQGDHGNMVQNTTHRRSG